MLFIYFNTKNVFHVIVVVSSYSDWWFYQCE